MSTDPHTLHPALANAKAFYRLMTRGALAKLLENGGSDRYHPKFHITERLVLVDEYPRDDCAIYVIPRGVKLTGPPAKDPRGEHNTEWPEFSGRRGAVLLFKVWQNGRWLHEGPWQQDASEVLAGLETKLGSHEHSSLEVEEAQMTSDKEEEQHLEAMARQAYATTNEQGEADGHDR